MNILTFDTNDSFSECQTVERMKVNYSCSVLGYSYHALDLTEDGAIRGYNSIVPTQYLYQGKKIIVGISGGTYVNKEFRKDVFIFKHLMDALFIYCRNEGMVMKVGVPNKNSFKYTLILNKAKMVGYLNYYILPVHFLIMIGLDQAFARFYLERPNNRSIGYLFTFCFGITYTLLAAVVILSLPIKSFLSWELFEETDNLLLLLFFFSVFCTATLRYLNLSYQKRLKVDDEHCPYNIAEFGNTSSTTIPLMIVNKLKDSIGGKKIVACGFGTGLAWGAFCFEPDCDIRILNLVLF